MELKDDLLDDKLDRVITQLAKLEVYIVTHRELIDKVNSKFDRVDELQKIVSKHEFMLKVGGWVVGLFVSLLTAKLFNKI